MGSTPDPPRKEGATLKVGSGGPIANYRGSLSLP